MDAEAVGQEEHVDAVDAIFDEGVGELVFDGEAGFAEDGEVGFGGVGGAAVAGGGVGDEDDVVGGELGAVGLFEETCHRGGVFGVVFGDDVELVGAADEDFGEDGVDVEVAADEEAVVGFDLGVTPVGVAVEVGVDGGVFEVGELAFEVGGEELWGVGGYEGVDEAWGEVGVVGGAGADEAALALEGGEALAALFAIHCFGVVEVLDEEAVHGAVALGGGGEGELGLRATAEAGEHHFDGFFGDRLGGGVDFVGEGGGEGLAADAVEGFGGAAEEGGRSTWVVDGVFGLGGDAEVVGDVELFEEEVKFAEPHVADHDVGGLEDGHHRAGVVGGLDDDLGAEGAGFAGAEAGAEAEDFRLTIHAEVELVGGEAVEDAGAELFEGVGAARPTAGGGGEAAACGDSGQQAHTTRACCFVTV